MLCIVVFTIVMQVQYTSMYMYMYMSTELYILPQCLYTGVY